VPVRFSWGRLRGRWLGPIPSRSAIRSPQSAGSNGRPPRSDRPTASSSASACSPRTWAPQYSARGRWSGVDALGHEVTPLALGRHENRQNWSAIGTWRVAVYGSGIGDDAGPSCPGRGPYRGHWTICSKVHVNGGCPRSSDYWRGGDLTTNRLVPRR
jgi:hypothetical protein